MKKIYLLGALALAGCATKNYGRLQPLSDIEKTSYDCREIAIEDGKVQAFQDNMRQRSHFNGQSALGLLGDLGMGNSIEKDSAVHSAKVRQGELNQLRVAKGCTQTAAATPSTPVR